MYSYKYPRPAVTTDCVLFCHEGDEFSVLLIQRGGEPFKGCWAFPGGFLNMDESEVHGSDDAADARWFPVRELPPLAFDHDLILQAALKRLQEKELLTRIGF